MARFRIPDEDIPKFKHLSDLKVETHEKILKTLSDAPLGCWSKELAELISKSAEIDSKTAEDIIDVLFSLTVTRRSLQQNIDSYLEDIIASLKKFSNKDFKVDDDLKELFKKYLSINSVQITIKAIELKYEKDKIFSDCRIITDIRPIFDDEKGDILQANVIIHDLRIKYKDSDGDHSIFLALDSDDINNLKEQIIRAEKKENRIYKGLEKIEFVSIKTP